MLFLDVEPFELKFTITKFGVEQIGNPFPNEDGEYVQKVHYVLQTDADLQPEHKNADVPVEIGGLITKFITQTITPEEKAGVTEYLTSFHPLLKLK